jgi:hypothetical protein
VIDLLRCIHPCQAGRQKEAAVLSQLLEGVAALHLAVEVEQNQEHLVELAAAGQLEPQHSIADSTERI